MIDFLIFAFFTGYFAYASILCDKKGGFVAVLLNNPLKWLFLSLVMFFCGIYFLDKNIDSRIMVLFFYLNFSITLFFLIVRFSKSRVEEIDGTVSVKNEKVKANRITLMVGLILIVNIIGFTVNKQSSVIRQLLEITKTLE